MPDQTLICTNCGSQFVFSEGEQDFYKQKNFFAPTLCPICRSIKAQQRLIPQRPNRSFSEVGPKPSPQVHN